MIVYDILTNETRWRLYFRFQQCASEIDMTLEAVGKASKHSDMHSAYKASKYNLIIKDLSGEAGRTVEGVFLHLLPMLRLTEYQFDRYFMIDLRRMITANIYLDNVRLDLDLKLDRPFPNLMLLTLTEKKNRTGVYLPIKGPGEYDVRVEWSIEYGIDTGNILVTHKQRVVIECNGEQPVLSIYSVPEASWIYSKHNSYSASCLSLTVTSDGSVTRERVASFGTTVHCDQGQLMYDEVVKIQEPLDLYGARFCMAMKELKA